MQATLRKPSNTIEQAREDHQGIPPVTYGQIPFIVYFNYTHIPPMYGVNYLDPETEKGSTYETPGAEKVAVTVVEKLYI